MSLLNHHFHGPYDAEVTPPYTQESSPGRSNGFHIPIAISYFDFSVEKPDILPVCFLVAKARGRSPNVSKSGASPRDIMKDAFYGFKMGFTVPTAYGMCAIGTRLWLYRCFANSNVIRRVDVHTEQEEEEEDNTEEDNRRKGDGDGVDIFTEEGVAKLKRFVEIVLTQAKKVHFSHSLHATGA
jgi:hypothetical protein